MRNRRNGSWSRSVALVQVALVVVVAGTFFLVARLPVATTTVGVVEAWTTTSLSFPNVATTTRITKNPGHARLTTTTASPSILSRYDRAVANVGDRRYRHLQQQSNDSACDGNDNPGDGNDDDGRVATFDDQRRTSYRWSSRSTNRRDWLTRCSAAVVAGGATSLIAAGEGDFSTIARAALDDTTTAIEMKTFVDPVDGYFTLKVPASFYTIRRSSKGDLPDPKTGQGRRGSSIFTAGDLKKAEVIAVERCVNSYATAASQ